MQQHQQSAGRRQCGLMRNSNKTKYDDFYTKLERLRLSAAASSSSKSSEIKLKTILLPHRLRQIHRAKG